MKKSSTGKSRRAFTLIELLTVISVVALLGTLTIPIVSNAAMGGKFNKALIDLSGALERAQAYAVANNTYTFVAFTEPDADGRISVGLFGSRDGSAGVPNLSTAGDTYAIVDARSATEGSLVALDHLTVLEGVKLQDDQPAGNGLSLKAASAWSQNGAKFSFRGQTFTRALQFTPTGEARVSSLLPEIVRVIAVPLKGDARGALTDAAGASAIQVFGLTGLVNVERPGTQRSL